MEVTVTDEGRETDKLLDSHKASLSSACFLLRSGSALSWEFGGLWGVTAMISDAHVLRVDMSAVL